MSVATRTNNFRNAVAARMGISRRQYDKLRKLINKAATAQEEYHNTGKDCDPETNAVDAFAKELGFTCDWNPGLYPMLIKGDLKVYVE